MRLTAFRRVLIGGGLLAWMLIPAVCWSQDHATAEQSQQAGEQALQRGDFGVAIVNLEAAAAQYEKDGASLKRCDALTVIGRAYQALGRYQAAAERMDLAQDLAVQSNDPARQAHILSGRASLAVAAGEYDDAKQYLTQGLRLAKDLNAPLLSATLLNEFGNLSASKGLYEDAAARYTESLALASNGQNKTLLARVHVNLAAASTHLGRYAQAKQQLDQAVAILEVLPQSHDQVFALTSVGLAYETLLPGLPDARLELTRGAYRAYELAAQVADTVHDARGESYAWGALAELYAKNNRDDEALELSRRAILAGQQAAAPEALYRWHWLRGRVLLRLGQPEEALLAYRRAVSTLQAVRSELIASGGTSATAFRDSVGAVYFELADLLLLRAAGPTDRAQPYLKEARETIELFKVDELRDYLGDDCVDSAQSRIASLESVATSAAVIYPIVLPDRLELLVSVPSGLQRVPVTIPANQLIQEVRAFRELLEKRSTHEYLVPAQRLYDWIIRPLEPLLAAHTVDTLVFVPDGALRTVPMAALHDGQDFLIRRYAVATTPGLTLTDPRPLKRQAITALSAGLSEAVQGYPALPYAAEEVQAVNQVFGGVMLLNKDFQSSAVEAALEEGAVSMIHIATHGEFMSDARKSFLLTYDDKLTMDRLEQLVGLSRYRQQPLDLLALSACETAAGDDRAALGLAGIAIKAGARSALATLWLIDDEASSLFMSEFYQHVRNTSLSKAVAVQRAQLSLLDHPSYQHPAYWAAFLMLNNWL